MQAVVPGFPKRLISAFRWQGFAWVVLVATTLATIALWHYSRHELERRSAERFAYLVERQGSLLTDRINDYERVLKGSAGLFAASGVVTRDEWRRYTESLNLGSALPGSQALGFVELIAPADKPAHEAAVRKEGFPDYTIHPAGEREIYSSIVYIEPFAGRNLRAFGFDMFQDPIRHEAMDRARDTAQPAVSASVKLIQETNVDVQAGFLIYVPVYRNGWPTSTVTQRRAAIVGFTYSPFRSRDLMQSIFYDPLREVDVTVYDGPPTPANMLYSSAESPRDAENVVDQVLIVGGHEWLLRCESRAVFERRTGSSQPDMILAGGLLLSLLLAGAIFNDARHNRRLEQQVRERTRQLEQARDEAESASRAKSAFLATVSHELRTPLNAIIGFSAILLDDAASGLAPEQLRQLQIINDSGRHLLDLIKDILDISSIEAGQLILHVETNDLGKILEEQTASMQTLADERGLQLRLEPSAEAVDVLADGVRLRQVLRNLVSNAIKFTDRGTVTVRQRVTGDRVTVEVEDTGIGIAPGELDSLFNNFERIGDRSGRLRPGTGLGLAISKRLIEAMDGTIGCTSVEGKGSRFWFSLPVARHGKAPVRTEQGADVYARIGG